MFAERHVLCRAVGKGQAEGGLLVNGRRDCANIRVIAEDAQKMRLPIFPNIDRCRLRSWITVFAACLFALLNQRLVQVGEFIDRIRSADRFILS